MPISVSPAWDGTLYANQPFAYTFSRSGYPYYQPSWQFLDSSPLTFPLTNAGAGTFSSTTGYSGSGNAGNLVVDVISTNPRYVDTIAGSGTAGLVDGSSNVAQFNYPTFARYDGNKNLYIADRFNFSIRKQDAITQRVSNFAFTFGGTYAPTGLAIDSNGGYYYIAAQGAIQKYVLNTKTFVWQTGDPAARSLNDGTSNVARFSNITAIELAGDGYLYATDFNTIRQIDPANGTAITYAGQATAGYVDGSINQTTVYAGNAIASLGPSTVSYSSNGTSWTSNVVPFLGTGIAFGNSYWAVPDSSGNFNVSSDLVTWSQYISNLFPPLDTTSFGPIAYGSNVYAWTAREDPGFGGAPVVAVASASGTGSGTVGTGAGFFPSDGLTCIATDGLGNWMVGGTNVATNETVSLSTDNTDNWAYTTNPPFTPGVTSMAYGGGRWLISGSGTVKIAISSNLGASWTSLAGTSPFNLQTFINSVAYGSNTWLVFATNGGTIRGIYSTNGGSTWTAGGTIATAPVTAVWNGQVWIASGNGKTFYTSNLASTWTQALSTGISAAIGNMTVLSGLTRFNTPTDIRYSAYDNSLYIADQTNLAIRKISAGTVSTDASGTGFAVTNLAVDPSGNRYISSSFCNVIWKNNRSAVYAGSGVAGFLDSDASTARFNVPRGLEWDVSTGSLLVADSANNRIRRVVPSQPVVRVSPSTPAGYFIVDTCTIPVTVSSRIQINDTAIGGTISLYKYEPFSNTYTALVAGDTLRVSGSSTELGSFLSNSGTVVTFQSAAGPGISYAYPLTLKVEALTGTTVVETVTRTVTMDPGRFLSPSPNGTYSFYRNEPISRVSWVSPIPLASIVSTPSLPIGLSFVSTGSNSADLVGTPTAQTPTAPYRIIGKDTSGRIVTDLITVSVSPERMILDVSGPLTQTLDINAAVTPVTVSARYPPYPANVFSPMTYTWNAASVPGGLQFLDYTGTPISGSSYVAYDLSHTITLAGALSSSAALQYGQSNQSTISLALRGTRNVLPAISNAITLGFVIDPFVSFSSSNVPPMYVGVPLSNVFYQARSYLTDASISLIEVLGDLPPGLATTFDAVESRIRFTGTPATDSFPPFTLRASNTTGSYTDLQVSNVPGSFWVRQDTVSFDYSITPAVDTCYNFIQFRPVSSAKTGWYPSNITFRATTQSGCNVVITSSDFTGTGISLSNVSANTYRIVGTPGIPAPLTSVTLTASAISALTPATTSIRYSISAERIDISAIPTPTFTQNVPIAPIQFNASTLSERPVLNWFSTNTPPQLDLSPGGLLTGTPTGASSGTFAITASTGYFDASSTISYTGVADQILILPPSNAYSIAGGQPVPSIALVGLSYSGNAASNYTFVGLPPGNYGMTVDSATGVFGGTFSNVLPASLSFSIQASVGLATGSLSATLTPSTLSFSAPTGFLGITPSNASILTLQYVPIAPITFASLNDPWVYYFMINSTLPRGLRFNSLTKTLSGTPALVGGTTSRVYAYDASLGVIDSTTISFSVIHPTLVKPQGSASAWTSRIRQYTTVNAAQNARDNRILNEDQNLGEFQAPMAPDVQTALVPANCFKSCSSPPAPAPAPAPAPPGNLPLTITTLADPPVVTSLPDNVYSIGMRGLFLTYIHETIVPDTTSLYSMRVTLPAVDDGLGDVNYALLGGLLMSSPVLLTSFSFNGTSYTFTINSTPFVYTPGDIVTISLQDKITGAIKIYLNNILIDDTLSLAGTFPFGLSLVNDSPSPLEQITVWTFSAI